MNFINLLPSVNTVPKDNEGYRVLQENLESKHSFARMFLIDQGIKDMKPLIKVSRSRRKKIMCV